MFLVMLTGIFPLIIYPCKQYNIKFMIIHQKIVIFGVFLRSVFLNMQQERISGLCARGFTAF